MPKSQRPQTQLMRFAAGVSEHEDTAAAAEAVLAQARADVPEPDVAFVFFTTHHREQADDLIERVWLELDPQAVIGCSAEGVIGGDQEIEGSPGVALLVGTMPDVRVHPFHIGSDDWRRLLTHPNELVERLRHGPATRGIIGFGDPWTTPLTQFMQVLDEVAPAPRSPLIGGMASGARGAGENLIVRNDQSFDDGFVGITLAGPIDVRPVVSQGCKPIGEPLIITKAHDNVVEQLGGKPALRALRDLVNQLPEHDQNLMQNGMFLGRAISEYRDRFGRGDFLIRNIMGVDQESGAMQVADFVRVGQTVQFHVRDAESADEDLSLMLDAERTAGPSEPPAAALLFSCNGRSTRLFDSTCHDVRAARSRMPQTPVAGFFAAGEIGPVGGKNFIHGHTASFALLRPARERE
jgi:small ligand-binding sensory domain FIST